MRARAWRVLRPLLAALVLCAAPLTAATAATAASGPCACRRARSVADAYAEAPVVFVARVLAVGVASGGAADTTAPRVGRVVVTRALKRLRVGDTVDVLTPGGDCGAAFAAGEELLVYARLRITKDMPGGFGRLGPPTPKLGTDQCAGTKPLRCAAADLRALGDPPSPDVGECAPSGASDGAPGASPREPAERAAAGRRPRAVGPPPIPAVGWGR